MTKNAVELRCPLFRPRGLKLWNARDKTRLAAVAEAALVEVVVAAEAVKVRPVAVIALQREAVAEVVVAKATRAVKEAGAVRVVVPPQVVVKAELAEATVVADHNDRASVPDGGETIGVADATPVVAAARSRRSIASRERKNRSRSPMR